MSADDLRKTSLLGSTTVLRVLAGAYYQLTEVQKFEDEDVVEFFGKLAPHTVVPVDKDSIWVKYVPDDIFVAGASAPRARRQDLKALRDAIVDWAIKDPSWLTSAEPIKVAP
jgi:hypothetical protein